MRKGRKAGEERGEIRGMEKLGVRVKYEGEAGKINEESMTKEKRGKGEGLKEGEEEGKLKEGRKRSLGIGGKVRKG